MTEEQTAPLREETMLYRKPTEDSDEGAIQDIWGDKLEVRVVDAPEVADFLAKGWVMNPLDLGKRPEERAGFEKVAGKELLHTRDALDTAEKLVAELEKRLEQKAEENGALKEQLLKLQSDLKAAEELADAETKAKEAALAELAEFKAKAKAGKAS